VLGELLSNENSSCVECLRAAARMSERRVDAGVGVGVAWDAADSCATRGCGVVATFPVARSGSALRFAVFASLRIAGFGSGRRAVSRFRRRRR
jgi:hypothetical protein